MGKVIKIIRSFILAVLLVLLLLPVAITLLLHVRTIQNYVVDTGLTYLSERAETQFSVEDVRFSLFNRFVFDGLYVEDYAGDTLFYAKKVVVPIRSLNLFTGAVHLGDVQLSDIQFNLIQDSTRLSNLKQILLKLKRKEKKREKKPFRLKASAVQIRNMNFRHRKYDIQPKSYGVNFTDLDVRDFNLAVHDISVVNDSVTLSIDSLRLHERCGLDIRNLSTDRFRISGTGLHFDRLRLSTAESDATLPYLYFDYDTWKGYKDFLQRVTIRSEFTQSTVSFRTIAYFAQGLKHWTGVLHDASGRVEGPVAALSGEVFNATIRDTRVKLQFAITGLPDVKQTDFSFFVQNLETRSDDVSYIIEDITGKALDPRRKKMLDQAGNITFSGHFDGLFNNFTADGNLRTSIGNADVKLHINPLSGAARTTAFNGTLNVHEFGVGTLLQQPKLGRLTLTSTVQGLFGQSHKMQAHADIRSLSYNDYTYQGIALNGNIENKKFTGSIDSQDPNLAFAFDGGLDFNDSLPAYNFNLNLQNADLAKLNFNRRDSVSQIHCTLKAEGSGIRLDDANGTIEINDMTYINHIDTVRTGQIRMVANNKGASKLLGFYSPFADIELKGKLSYDKMFAYFRNTLVSYLPSISDRTPEEKISEPAPYTASSIDNYYLLNVNVKESNNVAGIFYPGLELEQGTNLAFLFNPEQNIFSLTLNSALIETEDSFVSNLKASVRNQADSISLFVTAEETLLKGIYMPDFSVVGGAKENKINLAMRFNNTENQTYAMISTTSTLSADSVTGIPQTHIRFNPSTYTSGNQTWRIWARKIVIDSTQTLIDRFAIESGSQRLSINGTISPRTTDTLRLRLQNFDLRPLTKITGQKGYNIEGYTNGTADLIAAQGDRIMNADIDFDSLRVNDIPWKAACFTCNWDFIARYARFALVERESGDAIAIGYYVPDDHRYAADLNFRHIDMALLSPVLEGALENIKGSARARLTLTSRNRKPILNGTINVERFESKVSYTNVGYSLTESVADVKDNVITLRPTELVDPEGNRVGFDMDFNFKNLKNLSYTIHVRPTNTLVLNTTERQNDLFYGTIYASGNATIRGNRNRVSMDITASTAGNSRFFMPLGNGTDIAAADFIVFETPKQRAAIDSLNRANRSRRERFRHRMESLRSEMDINMTLDVRPNVEMQLMLDPTGDNLLKGRGSGSINLHVNPNNRDFTLYGDYNITEGSYRFSLQNFASRTFTIEDGSHIQWTGDPVNALVNIEAVYKLKASLAQILQGSGQNTRRNVPVDCIIRLSDRLSQPTITFDVNVPNTDPEIQSAILNTMNTQEMMSTQFLWLLATHSFYTENINSTQNLNIGAQSATTTGIEFLSTQLSNILSSERFRLAPTYRPKSEETSDEFGTEFYGELIKNKLIVEGDVSYDSGNNIQMNNRTARSLTGDVTLSLLLDEVGNFKVKAFTRTIDRFDENQGLQESGVGLSYRQNFNSFSDLVQNFRERIERIRQRKATKRMQKAARKGDNTSVSDSPTDPTEESSAPDTIHTEQE